MTGYLIGNEPWLRLGVFLGVFALCAAGERLRPRRDRHFPRARRWFTNFSMLGLATLLVRASTLLLPVLGTTMAASLPARHGWGLLHQLTLPVWLELAIAVVVLDLVVWAQHLATHHVPTLWRLHRVHHSDRDLDTSSALRFHPLEILFSAVLKLIAVLALGASVGAVILFEIILNASALFNHANMELPGWLDRLLRTVLVTPDMHRVHHSVIRAEHDRNFGFFLSVWDRLFGTYKERPDAGHTSMIIGLDAWQDDRPAQLAWSLCLPFERE